jgi:putative DNA primase/helicase
MHMPHREQFARMAASVNGMAPEYLTPHLLFVAKQIGDLPRASGGESWETPLPLPALLPDVPTMTPEMVPHGLRPWLTDIADRVQCPLEYVAVSAMVALAAVIGRRIGIYPKRHDDWLVIPNVWGMLVGRPGVLKSPAMVEAMKPLDRLVYQAMQAHQGAMQDYEVASAKYEAQHKALKAEMAKAAKRSDDEAMEAIGQRIAALVDKAPVCPVPLRYKTNDSTVEKLQDLLAENPQGLLLYRDKLAGFLYNLEKPGREGDREFYLECWAGNGSFTLDRIGRGTVHSTALCLSLLGSIQPGKLTEYVAGTMTGGIGDDGLLQRLQLAVWPDTRGTWQNVDRWPDTEAKQRAWLVFQRLSTLHRDHIPSPDSGAFTQDMPPGIRFAPSAQEIFDRWRTHLEACLRSDTLHPAMESHLAKYRSLMPTLALLFHRSVYRKQWSMLRTPEDTYGALSELESLHWVRVEPEKTDGRSRDVIRINPAITDENKRSGTILTPDKTDISSPEADQQPPSVSNVSCQLANGAKNLHLEPRGEEEEYAEKALSPVRRSPRPPSSVR